MKHLTIGLALALSISVVAHAGGTNANASSYSGADSFSQGIGVGGASGSSSSSRNELITNNGNTYEAQDLGDAVAAVIIPALTTSNGTCMGSTSGGVGVSGFGAAFGTTYTSDPCNVRFNANQMNALGQPDLALELMCSQDSVYEADLRMGLAGGKQICTPRDEASTDPVATWFPTDNQNTMAMLEGSVFDEPQIVWGGQYEDMGGER